MRGAYTWVRMPRCVCLGTHTRTLLIGAAGATEATGAIRPSWGIGVCIKL